MLPTHSNARIFVHQFDTDMRKSFDGLCAIVQNAFGKSILSGDLFVFFNRASNRCKILLWDRDGLIVWAKRLERGGFQRPQPTSADAAIEIDNITLSMILAGVDLHSAKRRKRFSGAA